jgi:hypothetical protein
VDTTPAGPRPSAPTSDREPIRAFLSGRHGTVHPLVLLMPEGAFALALGRTDAGVEVFTDGAVRQVSADHEAVRVFDDDQRGQLMHRALDVVAADRHTATERPPSSVSTSPRPPARSTTSCGTCAGTSSVYAGAT